MQTISLSPVMYPPPWIHRTPGASGTGSFGLTTSADIFPILIVSARTSASGRRRMFIFIVYSLQFIILRRTAPRLLHRVLGFILRHFAHDDLIHIKPQLIEHILAVDDDVRQFLLHVLEVVFRVAPLEALQELVRLNGNGLGQVRRRVECKFRKNGAVIPRQRSDRSA